MVFSETDSPNPTFHMPMPPEERSRTLHNFSLPCLKWGGQKHLRCVRPHGSTAAAAPPNHFRRLARRSPPTSSKAYAGLPPMLSEPERKRRSVYEVDDSWTSPAPAETEIERRFAIGADVEAVRKRLMLDLQTEMDKMRFAVLSEKIAPPPTKTVAPVPAEERPWNLRTRRAVCKDPNANGGGAGKSQRVEEGDSRLSPARQYIGIKRRREKFSIPLSKQEIEEDLIAMTGVRPPRKPKKRPRSVQRQLDTVFPGLWLSEITTDMYKVIENPETGKK